MTHNKPNILFINNTSMMGAGTSQSLYVLLKYLSDSYNVSVVSDRESQELPQNLANVNISHYALHDRTILFLPELIFHILTRKIDLVYGNNLSGRSQVAFWAARLTRRPFIWHIRESVRKNDPRAKQIRHAAAVIANSDDTAKRLTEFASVKSPTVIPNGVELEKFELDRDLCRRQLIDEFRCPSDSVFVINLGRICEQKNQSEAVQVALEILESHPQTQFSFLGEFQDPDYVAQMNQKINTSAYCDHFHILGHINDFIPYLFGSDILLHTSRVESQGRVILEAMASRLPVVAYDVGGVGEAVVHGETGFLRPFGDIEGLASVLKLLIQDKHLREQFGQAGNKRVTEFFASSTTAAKVKQVIDRVLLIIKWHKI